LQNSQARVGERRASKCKISLPLSSALERGSYDLRWSFQSLYKRVGFLWVNLLMIYPNVGSFDAMDLILPFIRYRSSRVVSHIYLCNS